MNSKMALGSMISLLLPICILAQSQKGNMLVGKVPEEQFGRNVKIAADGNTIAIAAPFYITQGEKKGRISVYKFNGTDWQILGSEIAAGPKDFDYGELMELSADGKKLVVSSPFGSVSIYTFNSTEWIKSSNAIELESNSQIESIAITPDADKLAVAYECDKHRTVCINLFYSDGKQWQKDGEEIIPEPNERIYGLSLSLSADGSQLVVGNYSKDTKQHKNAGEVIIYAKEANQWRRQSKKFNGELLLANLGKQVALSKDGSTIIAASSSIDLLELNAGFIETYKLSGTEWFKKTPVLKPEKYNPYFGHAISISADGTILALSIPYIGFGKPGYVKVYKYKSSGWQEIFKITDVEGVEKTKPPNNTVGWSIALSSDGKTIAIGFPHNDENGDMSGKVMLYDLSSLIQ